MKKSKPTFPKQLFASDEQYDDEHNVRWHQGYPTLDELGTSEIRDDREKRRVAIYKLDRVVTVSRKTIEVDP